MSDIPQPFIPAVTPSYPPVAPPTSLQEYQYHSQYSTDLIGLVIGLNGVPTNADDAMNLTLYPVPPLGTQAPTQTYDSGQSYDQNTTYDSTAIFSDVANNSAPGVYEYQLNSSQTATVGYYRVEWDFTLNAVAQTVSTFIEIGPYSPAYDALSQPFKEMVEDVWLKMADGYDSAAGGPNVQEWYQTHFNRGRVAQLLKQAVQHLNNIAQPYSFYTVDGFGPTFPILQWGGLLNTALTVEVLKHLMRAYVEDPDIQGAVQARMIRRDYMARWGSLLSIEQETLKSEQDTFKISQMFQGSPRVLLSGGAYGRYGPVRMLGNLVARPNFWMRTGF